MRKPNPRRTRRRSPVDIEALQRIVDRAPGPQRDHQRILTDGPYIETKEMIAG